MRTNLRIQCSSLSW